MILLIHDIAHDTEYIAKCRSDCKDSIDSGLWDMHERFPSKAWSTGKTCAVKLD